MKIQILLATMNREDYQFLDDINLFGDGVVVVNQCNKLEFEEIKKGMLDVKVISTTQRGLSNSRNQALLYADQDIFLTADDDISYYMDAQDKIIKAFEKHPEADIIAFNIERINTQERSSAREIEKWREAPKNKYYSSVSLAYRTQSVKKANLSFHTFFGAGSRYRSGEESLLLREARRKGLRIFECPEYIAKVDFSTSTWFTGFDEKFFFDKGAWVRAAYPNMYRVMKYYFLTKRKRASISVKAIIKALNAGIKAYDDGSSYNAEKFFSED